MIPPGRADPPAPGGPRRGGGQGEHPHPATLATPAGGPAAWLFLPGLALMTLAALLAARLT